MDLRTEFDRKIRIELQYKLENGCVNCGNKADQLHHIVPLALGGTNKESNIVPLCAECHRKIHGVSLKKKLQEKGIERAKANGQRFGRPTTEYPANWNEVYKQWKNEEITAVNAMKVLGLSKATFYRLVKKYEEA